MKSGGFPLLRRGMPRPEVSRLNEKEAVDAGPPISDDHLFAVVDALDEIARETGKTIPQIALNWLLQRPTVSSVIIGARDEEQLRQNLGATGWNLDAGQMARLNGASRVRPMYPYWHQQSFSERNPRPAA